MVVLGATGILAAGWVWNRPSGPTPGSANAAVAPTRVQAAAVAEQTAPAPAPASDAGVVQAASVNPPPESAPPAPAANAPAAPATPSPEAEVAAAAPEAATPKADLPKVELPLLHITNQNGTTFQRKPGARGVGMVMVGFAWRDKADMWTRGFKENLPADVQMALVMNLKGQSRLKEKFLTSMMRMDVGDEPIEIYLDWEGEIAAAYGVEDGKAAALTVGADDRLLEIAYDDRDDAKLKRLIDSFGPAKP